VLTREKAHIVRQDILILCRSHIDVALTPVNSQSFIERYLVVGYFYKPVVAKS
jgi:hypothetical protein